MTLPATVDGLGDSPVFRRRGTGIMQRHTEAIVEAVQELGDLGLVAESSAEVRVAPAVPMFTLYVRGSQHAADAVRRALGAAEWRRMGDHSASYSEDPFDVLRYVSWPTMEARIAASELLLTIVMVWSLARRAATA
ncbi:hypothetical protein ACL02T_11945 [Pseudonocardia sp. RS010]|uniref:hypothetical protein n=1 Tax=Pseudonocardia sp. RS010 TaxID=3385979 RepID=UPI00399FB57A